MISILSPTNNKKCVLASSNGKGFIVETLNLISNQKKGKQIINLKPNDKLIKVLIYNKSHIAITNKLGKLLIFDIESLPTLQKGSGVQLIKIKNKDILSDIQLINPSEGISWQTASKIRTLKEIKFWIGKRAQSGKKVPKYFNKNLKFYD